MRTLVALATVSLMSACQESLEQQQADRMRGDAQQRGDVIEKQADNLADGLERQARALETEANQVGGMTGERIRIRADALEKEAKVIRKQADMQADSIKEAADAGIKASESR